MAADLRGEKLRIFANLKQRRPCFVQKLGGYQDFACCLLINALSLPPFAEIVPETDSFSLAEGENDATRCARAFDSGKGFRVAQRNTHARALWPAIQAVVEKKRAETGESALRVRIP